MNKLLKSIYESQLPFLELLPVERTYQGIVDEAISLSDMNEGSLFLMQKGRLKRVYSSSPEFYDIKIRKTGLTYKGFKTKDPYLIQSDPASDIHPQLRNAGIKSVIAVPLMYRDKPLGVISLYGRRKHKFSKRQLERLLLFVTFSSLSLQKAQLYSEVEKAMSVRDLFIAAASHELRTPLTTINGYIELLKKKSSNSSDKTLINDLYKENIRLQRLVEKLDEANKIRSNNIDFNLREYAISNVIDESIKVFNFFYNDYPIETQSAGKLKHAFCIVDFEKLSLALFNILENAAKYSRKNGKIIINSEFADGHISISIIDKGSGISKEKIDSILQNSPSDIKKNGESLGLGLYLTKNIVERHRGSLSIQSEEDLGTTVKINLPIHHLN